MCLIEIFYYNFLTEMSALSPCIENQRNSENYCLLLKSTLEAWGIFYQSLAEQTDALCQTYKTFSLTKISLLHIRQYALASYENGEYDINICSSTRATLLKDELPCGLSSSERLYCLCYDEVLGYEINVMAGRVCEQDTLDFVLRVNFIPCKEPSIM